MKKQLTILALLFLFSGSIFAQVSQGDIQIIQKYFGVEKAALLKEYMKFTPQQDSAFWPIYNKYENERLALGSQRVALIDEYMKKISNIAEAEATGLVDRGADLEINFKKTAEKVLYRNVQKDRSG